MIQIELTDYHEIKERLDKLYNSRIKERIEELKTELSLKKVKYGITFSYSTQIEILSDIKSLAFAIKELERLVK